MSFHLDDLIGQNQDSWLKAPLEAGFPTSKNEDFKYFPLSGFPQELTSPIASKQDIGFLLEDLPISSENLKLVVLDGQIQWEDSSPQLRDFVVQTDDFSADSKSKMKEFSWDYFKAVSLLKQEGVFSLTVEKESLLEQKKVQIVLIQSQPNTLCVPHFEILLQPNTYFDLSVWVTGSSLNQAGLNLPYFFVQLKESAEIQFSQILSTEKEHFSFPYFDVYQEENSLLRSFTSYLKGFKSRIALSSMLAGEQAKCDLKGFYLTENNEQCEFYTRVYHRTPKTFSNQLFKGICGKDGHFSFNGDIIVSEHAKGVEAYQLSKNMITAQNSKVFTRPQLHISHHELKCTHGATVGGLNPEELFYLQSRGLSLPQARHLSMIGFLDEVANTIPDFSTREWVKLKFISKLEQ